LEPVLSVVGGGLGTVLIVLAVLWTWPEVLRLGSLDAVEPADANTNGSGLATGKDGSRR
jgi:hypothetical protein